MADERGEKTTTEDCGKENFSYGDLSPRRKNSELVDFGSRSRGRQRETPGILRVDSISRSPRYSIAASSLLAPQVVPSSPQPSVDRFSVTFAIAEDPGINDLLKHQKSQLQIAAVDPAIFPLSSKDVEMRRMPAVSSIADAEEVGDEDDYSASASAIIQRRASLRRPSRRKRRSSSPFNQDAEGGVRRRSSAFTTSSGDTAISVEEGGTQEQIFENLKLHKEVLSGVKQQPWPLRRKMKLVQQAKSYVRRHEGALQERLAQNRSTRDVIARASILFNKNWQYFRREFVNLQTWLIPWELRIKEIESHFGSAVASYFVFLRWLFWINLVITAILAAFVAVPEMLTADETLDGERKIMLPEEKEKSKHFLTLWEFGGALKYSPFFYGYYTNHDSRSGYRLPLAYFLVNLVVYIYSFVAILRKMAENSRMSKLSEKEDECAFTWKLFTGWDFMIGNPETAHNRIASIVLGFKEALLEEAEKQKVARNWKTTFVRTFVNIAVAGLLALSAFAVVQIVSRSTGPEAEANWWRQNEITIVMSLISFCFPMAFELLGLLENYHPRKQLRFQLARIMMLNLLNLYSLIIALFKKIDNMTDQLKELKPVSPKYSVAKEKCGKSIVPCRNFTSIASLCLALANINSQNLYTPAQSLTETNSVAAQALTVNATLQVLDSITGASISAATERKDNDEEYEYDWEKSNYTDDESYFANNIPEPREGSSITVQTEYTEDSTSASTTYERSSTEIYGSTHSSMTYLTESNTESYDFTDPSATYSNGLKTTESYRFTDPSSTHSSSDSYSDSSIDTFSYTVATSTASSFNESETHPDSTTDSTSETTEAAMTVSGLSTDKPPNVVINCCNQCCDESEPPSEEKPSNETAYRNRTLDISVRKRLRRLCWETMFGQELTKLTFMDLVLTIFFTLGTDFFRAVFIRHMNNFWCWDLEKQFPQYGDFKIAENILHLVNNQGMVWMGMFFSPGLPALNVLKIGILMYLRSWAVLTCNVPHEIVFRASRSNNFYLALLLTMLFLCVLPVGYAIVWVEPSWHCGPFSEHHRMYSLVTKSLKAALPETFHRILDYIASPGIVIPLIVLMSLIIYYMVSLTGSLREANNDLRIQLRQERTEERRKMFRIVEKRHDINDAPLVRWKKILPILPTSKTAEAVIEEGIAANVSPQRKELRKQSAASEAGEATDVEQDSLPHDPAMIVEEVAVDVQVPKNKRLIEQTKNRGSLRGRRSYSSGSGKEGDSMGSQCSDYGVIPKIRISGTEVIGEACHSSSPGRSSGTSPETEIPITPVARSSGSKHQAE